MRPAGVGFPVLLLTLLLISVTAGTGYGRNSCRETASKAPKYLFLFIGDGMGPAHVRLSDALQGSHRSSTMTSFPVSGSATTWSADHHITDSAAAATALATGCKTNSGTVSMAVNRRDTLKTVAEMAKAKGMKVGIVSSVFIDDATPACFYAHNPDRKNYHTIARQMATSGVDYFGGGSAAGNFPKNRPDSLNGRNDITLLMRAAHYAITSSRISLEAVPKGSRCWAVTTCDEKGAMDFAMDRPTEALSLAEFTRHGIRLLDNPKGFFMMVEGGKIDWASHSNDAAAAMHDVVAFDQAIGEAVSFYRQHPRQTLIVVTADHECGGLTLGNRTTRNDSRLALLQHQKISGQRFAGKVALWKKNGGVTFSMVLDSVRAYIGPGNTAADPSLALSAGDRTLLQQAYSATFADQTGKEPHSGSVDIFTPEIIRLLDTMAGAGWTSNAHTAVPVRVFAIGRGAGAFSGNYDNTDIAKKIMRIAALQSRMR